MRAAPRLLLVLVPFVTACVSLPERSPADLGIPEIAGGVPAEPSTEPDRAWRAVVADDRLAALIEEALGRNRDLRAIAARVEAAGARARIAGADALPQVSATFSGARQRQSFIGLPIPGTSGVLSSTSNRYGASTDVSWEADLWGRVAARREAARADAGAAAEDLAAARLALAARVARAYWAATESTLQLSLAEETVESYARTRDAVRRRYEAGIAPALDLRLLGAQAADAEALVALRRAELEGLTRLLEVLLGRYPHGELESARDLPAVDDVLPDGAPASLIASRPDLRAAERRLRAADARLAEARASLYPSFRLTASGGTSSNELGDLLDGDFRIWSLIAGIAQPVFQGGRLRAAVDVADAGTRDALESFANRALLAFSEVETALAVDTHLAERERALAEADGQATAARRISEDQYAEGLSDVLVLLEARRRQLATRGQLLAVRRARLDNRIDLALALGGSVPVRAARAVPREADASAERDPS